MNCVIELRRRTGDRRCAGIIEPKLPVADRSTCVLSGIMIIPSMYPSAVACIYGSRSDPSAGVTHLTIHRPLPIRVRNGAASGEHDARKVPIIVIAHGPHGEVGKYNCGEE